MKAYEFVEFKDLEGVTFRPEDETARSTLVAAAQSGLLGRCVRAFTTRSDAISADPLDFGFVQTAKGPVLYDSRTGRSCNLLSMVR